MSILTTERALSLSELEAFDPQAPAAHGRERRFACPFPACAGKPLDAAHRSLSLNTETGRWCCHRCGGAGVLIEHRPASLPRAAARQRLRRAFALAPAPVVAPISDTWQGQLKGALRLPGTPAEAYLAGRGIPAEVARAAAVAYAPVFYGRPAVVFPIRDREGQLRAVNGRFLADGRWPKTMTAGTKSAGLFATAGALVGERIVVTEAPVDALSLAACGLPALALVGTSGPAWLPAFVAFKRVLIALDADQEGDAKSKKLAAELGAFGARVARLRPNGMKDWNEALQRLGQVALSEALARLEAGSDDSVRIDMASRKSA